MNINAYNWNGCLDKVLKEIEGKHKLVTHWQNADVVVLWNEIERAGYLDLVFNAQEMGIPVILYQQGAYGIDRVRPPFNEKIRSDVVLVWGPGDRIRLTKHGVPAKKIIITGSPVIDRLKPRVPHEGKNVVFALEHWDWGDVPENHIVGDELKKLKGVNLITKGLSRENHTESFTNPMISSREHGNHLDIVADLLSRTDLVVAISESTFALLAEVLDIPVIIPDVWKPKPRAGEEVYLKFKKNCSDAVTTVPLNKLNKEVYRQLKQPDIKKAERLNNAIMNGGIGIKNPVQNIINVIERYGQRFCEKGFNSS